MPTSDFFQSENYKAMIQDSEKQIRQQKAEIEEFKNQFKSLANELLFEIDIGLEQITPEFDHALAHKQKSLKIQEAYHSKLLANLNKLNQVGEEIDYHQQQQQPGEESNHEKLIEDKRKELSDYFNNRGEIDREKSKNIQEYIKMLEKDNFMNKHKLAIKFCEQAFKGVSMDDDGDDDMQVESNTQTVKNKCPLTQKEFVTPVCIPTKCKKCVFEKLAILDYVQSKPGDANHRNVRCPTPGCPTKITKDSDIETDEVFTRMLLKYLKNNTD